MEKPIRILQVLGIVGGGGVEAVILEYYKHINRDKVQFDFIVHDDNKIDITEQIDAMGGRVYKVTPYYKNPIAFMIDIYHIIRKYNYKIIHVNMNTLSVFSLFPAWIAKVPVRILHNHSTSSPGEAKRNILKSILRPFSKLFATHYWACSNFAALWMYGQKVAKTDNKVTIIHNAINLEKFAFDLEKRNQLRHSLGLEGKFVVGHVGRFVFQKNHEFLIDVFNFALQQQPNLELMLIGDGPLKSLMQKKTKLLKINNKVKSSIEVLLPNLLLENSTITLPQLSTPSDNLLYLTNSVHFISKGTAVDARTFNPLVCASTPTIPKPS